MIVKVKEDMAGWVMSEHGVPDSRLTVIRQTEDYIDAKGCHYAMYQCKCNCNDEKIINIRACAIKSGATLSCGCLHRESLINTGRNNKKYNDYDLSGTYGIGWTSNTNKEFYFDLEDYDKIKNYCWNEHKVSGKEYYALEARDYNTKQVIRMSNLLGYKNYDHINRNTLDNRKCNFRKCTPSDNTKNRNKSKNNTSGIIGVNFNIVNNLWVSRINDSPYHRIIVYSGKNKNDAIVARLQAEAKYYGDFAPQKHLFEQYGIEVNGNE